MKIKRRAVFLSIGLILLTTIVVSVGTQLSHTQEPIPIVRKTPVTKSDVSLNVLSQHGSAMKISNLVEISGDSNGHEIAFNIEVVGKQPIVAYAIRSEDDCGGASNAFQFQDIQSKSKMLRPGGVTDQSLIAGGCSEPVSRITLSVDFIEFENGTYWGDDRSQTREMLAGMRAGARDETANLIAGIKMRGMALFTGEIQNETVPTVPPGHTDAWIRGYKHGRIVRLNEAKRAFSESGEKGVKEKLSAPFDASGKGDN